MTRSQVDQAVPTDRGRAVVWLRATASGWLLGVPLIVALALLGEAVGIGGAQFLVGVGMGAGLGLTQGRAIRTVLPGSAPWFWSCVLGLAVPFAVFDVALKLGSDFTYSVYVCVLMGGLIVGIWQAVLLRPHVRNAHLWVVASLVGWSLAALTISTADVLQRSQSLRGLWGALVYLGIIAAGGVVLGLVTGTVFARFVPPGSDRRQVAPTL
jgi:hypothetical protein